MISNVVMIGDKRPYNTCLISLKQEGYTGEFPGDGVLMNGNMAGNLGKEHGISTTKEAKDHPAFKAAIQQAIDETNKDPVVCQNKNWCVQKFTILPADFSLTGGEFTATLKLKRNVVMENYKEQIEAMYQ